MTTYEEIEQSVRSNLPLVFDQLAWPDQDAFVKKFDSLVDYAAMATEPFLRPETTRYQSILLYVSLVFVTVGLFGIGEIKLGEILLSVDRKLLIVYAIFITIVAVIFLVKAYVDHERANFTQNKIIHPVGEIRHVVYAAFLKRNIQQYFWFEIFDAIGRAYRPYSEATARSLNKASDFNPRRMNVLALDLAKLRKLPELAVEIEVNEKYLAKLSAELAKDVEKFEEKVEIILTERDSASNDHPFKMFAFDDSCGKISDAFDQCLRGWFDARNNLTDKSLSVVLDQMIDHPDLKRGEAMPRMFKHIVRIRRLNVVLEIFAPVLFAVIAIFYVWFSQA